MHLFADTLHTFSAEEEPMLHIIFNSMKSAQLCNEILQVDLLHLLIYELYY